MFSRPGPIPKTRRDLAAFEDAGDEVPAGIWYEVAVAEYLSQKFAQGDGWRIDLTGWCSADDLASIDGRVYPPDEGGMVVTSPRTSARSGRPIRFSSWTSDGSGERARRLTWTGTSASR